MNMRTPAILALAVLPGLLWSGCVDVKDYETCKMSPNIVSVCEEIGNLEEGSPDTSGTCVVADHPQCLTDACMLFEESMFCTDACEPADPQPMPDAGCDVQQGFRAVSNSRFIREYPVEEATDTEEGTDTAAQQQEACAECNSDVGENCPPPTVEQRDDVNYDLYYCTWTTCAKRDVECKPGIECVESDTCPEGGKCFLYLYDVYKKRDFYYCVRQDLAVPIAGD